MKTFAFFVFVGCCLVSTRVFAQTPKAIEADLLKSFKQIDEWSSDTGSNASESLWRAKKTVGEKFFFYTSKFPSTISYPFNSLKKEHVDISTSDDGKFRIYSWDTWTGGTMHFFESVFQYKAGSKTMSVLDTVKQEGDSRPNYYKLYTFKANNKTYYLVIWLGIASTLVGVNAIQVFNIENGKLNDEVKLIKTQTGLHNQLSYEYDNGWHKNYDINFDAKTQSIRLPLINSEEHVARNFTTYKFTGKYFEKVKN